MINNFQTLDPLIQFDSTDDCYFVQFLKRHKDNPEMTKNMINVDNMFIYSKYDYWKYQDRIIEIANLHNARAYIRINRRSVKKIALLSNTQVAHLLLTEDYKAVKNAYLSAAGDHRSINEPVRKWIVDLDNPIEKKANRDAYQMTIKNIINALHSEYNLNSKKDKYQMLAEIPTQNGIHVITNPFNLQRFREVWKGELDIHKDNPTILYMPTQKVFTPVDKELFDHPGTIGI